MVRYVDCPNCDNGGAEQQDWNGNSYCRQCGFTFNTISYERNKHAREEREHKAQAFKKKRQNG